MTPIKVLHGSPTPEEIAAVVAVVSARANALAAAPRAEDDGTAAVWSSRSRALARAAAALPKPGPTSWRTSAWA